MSQFDFGTIDASTKSGSQLALDLNDWRDAVHSSHKGSSAPSYITAGMTWVNDSVNPWVLNLYDGADSIALGTFNTTTNVFTVSGIGSIVQAYSANIPTVLASQAEMEAGTEADIRSMSPLRVAQAIAALGGNTKTTGDVVQIVNLPTNSIVTTTTTIPLDDTIPQNTEGGEMMTLAITPTNSANLLHIESLFVGGAAPGASYLVTAALFKDSDSNALCASTSFAPDGGMQNVKVSYFMTAGTTSPITFKLRAGMNVAGTLGMNGQGGSRRYGDIVKSSMIITEYKV